MKPNEQVWAYKRQSKGEVTVHRPAVTYGWVTKCYRSIPGGDYRWLWVEYRTLNPDKAVLCQRCFR